MEIIMSTLNEVLLNLALGVLALLAAYGVYYIQKAVLKLQAQTTGLKSEQARTLLNNAIIDVQNLAFMSVSALEQTTAKALREQVRNGYATREDLLALGQKTFIEVKSAIAPDAQRLITKNLEDFDSYLTKVIEDAVRQVKIEDPYITLGCEVAAVGEGETIAADEGETAVPVECESAATDE